MVSVWKNHDSFRLLLPQREGILTLSEIEKTGPKEETAVWRHLHNNTLWSNLILERGLTIGRGRSAGGCNVCPKGWFSQLQQRERDLLRDCWGKCFPASRDPTASVLWDLLLTAGKLLSLSSWASVSFHSNIPEDAGSGKAGMHDSTRGVIVHKAFLEEKKKVIHLILFYQTT